MIKSQTCKCSADYETASFNLMFPRSHCPQCKQTLGPLQLVPVLSWICQRGRCHHCAEPVSWRYPLTELACGFIFMAALYMCKEPLYAMALSLFITALVALAQIDFHHKLLPDAITLPLLWCGLLWNATGLGMVTLESAVTGAAVGYLALWSTYWLYRLIRKREGLGYGDFKLMAALGAWLGIECINPILILGPLIAALSYGLLCRDKDTDKTIPFGPALIAAALIWLSFRMLPLTIFMTNIPFSLSRWLSL